MRIARSLRKLAWPTLLFIACPAWAGPPFLTDDPAPTEPGHWEIYAPLVEFSGTGHDYEGSIGTELNYGAARDLQLTVGLPVAFAHDADGTRWGRGDLELSAKYRFYHDDSGSFSVAAFPGLTLPTASNHMGNKHVTALLPVWAQKDWGSWSILGGGGYAINPGHGNRDYWTGGVAVTDQVSKALLLGVEADRQGADTFDGRAETSLGIGAILNLKPPFRLLASAGPTFVRGQSSPSIHGFLALGLDF